MIEDELLKLRFKAGSIDALQRIYEKYRDYLLTLAMSNDAATAEDIVHDVFVAFAQSGSKFRLHGSLRAYLAACVVNRIRDQARAARRRGRALNDETPLEPDFEPADGRILSDERSWLVARALARMMDPNSRVLRFLSCKHKELGQKTIAGVLCEGIETTDPAFHGGEHPPESLMARVWVSVETGYPVHSRANL